MFDYSEEVLSAAENGHVGDLWRLIGRERADPNAVVRSKTPLIAAASRGQVAAVKELLSRGADVSLQAGPSGLRPLHAAVRAGHAEVAAVLLQSGADPNALSGLGPPLLLASTLDVVDLLLDAGADVNATFTGGKTAAHRAAFAGRAAIFRRLLEAGASAVVEDNQRETPLLRACVCTADRAGSGEVARLVMEAARAQVVVVSDALVRAALYGNHGVAEALLTSGVSLAAQDLDYALERAVAGPAVAKRRVCELLIEAGADATRGEAWFDDYHAAPLIATAAAKGPGGEGEAVTELLMRHGADTGLVTEAGRATVEAVQQRWAARRSERFGWAVTARPVLSAYLVRAVGEFL